MIYLLENEGHSRWPATERTTTTSHEQTRETARKLLLDDYRFILKRAKSITIIVREGIAAITTEVMTRDAQRSVEQGRRMGRITVLAYFFLPISLVTSVYGMNFANFDEDSWKGVLAFVCTLLSVFIPSTSCASGIECRGWPKMWTCLPGLNNRVQLPKVPMAL